jgi:glycosyltransferase involved in cell wall biosynthesis
VTEQPLVSIVTPTIPDRLTLLRRCSTSVKELDWPRVQHVIVSDRNRQIAAQHAYETWPGGCRQLVIVEINESWRNPTSLASVGAVPFQVGSLLALGEFVGYCGDDDELLPDHISRHVTAMRQAEAHFSISAVEFRIGGDPWRVIGPSFDHGNLDAIGIMCHKDALAVATWTANGEDAADYRLVRDWLAAGLRGVLVDGGPTAIHHDGWAARQ